jgi:hypothetical protein
MDTKMPFPRGCRVHAAGLRGRVTNPDVGSVGYFRLHGLSTRLVEVQWDGQATPVAVREDMLNRVPARRRRVSR